MREIEIIQTIREKHLNDLLSAIIYIQRIEFKIDAIILTCLIENRSIYILFIA